MATTKTTTSIMSNDWVDNDDENNYSESVMGRMSYGANLVVA